MNSLVKSISFRAVKGSSPYQNLVGLREGLSVVNDRQLHLHVRNTFTHSVQILYFYYFRFNFLFHRSNHNNNTFLCMFIFCSL